MAMGRRHREHFRDLPVAGVTAPCPHGHAGPHQAACVSPVSVSRLPETFQLRRAKGNGVRFFRRSGLQREIRQHALPSLSRRNVWKWCPRDPMGKEDACSAGYSRAFSSVYLEPGWKCGGENVR